MFYFHHTHFCIILHSVTFAVHAQDQNPEANKPEAAKPMWEKCCKARWESSLCQLQSGYALITRHLCLFYSSNIYTSSKGFYLNVLVRRCTALLQILCPYSSDPSEQIEPVTASENLIITLIYESLSLTLHCLLKEATCSWCFTTHEPPPLLSFFYVALNFTLRFIQQYAALTTCSEYMKRLNRLFDVDILHTGM